MSRSQRILLALLVLQIALLATVWSRRTGTPTAPDTIEFFRVGDSYRSVVVGPEAVLDLDEGPWTLVLAFSASCVWCDSVAPAWEALTRYLPAGVRLVGVTRDAPDVARNYVEAHRWQLPALLALADSLPETPGAQITSRTPWYYLFDSLGTLRRSGHGAAAARAVDEILFPDHTGETRP